jgi:hypothetical protein
MEEGVTGYLREKVLLDEDEGLGQVPGVTGITLQSLSIKRI